MLKIELFYQETIEEQYVNLCNLGQKFYYFRFLCEFADILLKMEGLIFCSATVEERHVNLCNLGREVRDFLSDLLPPIEFPKLHFSNSFVSIFYKLYNIQGL